MFFVLNFPRPFLRVMGSGAARLVQDPVINGIMRTSTGNLAHL